MADIDVAGLARSILDSVKSGAGKFLEDHKDAQAFVVDRAKRLAQLTFDLAVAGDGAAKAQIREQIGVVEQSIQNELSAVAVDASVASRAQFDAAVRSVFAFAAKALPLVLGAI
jgi:hypothetical protein